VFKLRNEWQQWILATLKLYFSRMRVKVIVNVRPKYACKACEKNGTSNTIKQALVTASIIPEGYTNPNLLSLPTVPKLLPVNTSSAYRFTGKNIARQLS
jgi:hypothetical protein